MQHRNQKQRKPQVFIISSIILSETEMKVLSTSYNYTLTPRIDNNWIETGIKLYTRKPYQRPMYERMYKDVNFVYCRR